MSAARTFQSIASDSLGAHREPESCRLLLPRELES
jgi:hypothetical protein